MPFQMSVTFCQAKSLCLANTVITKNGDLENCEVFHWVKLCNTDRLICQYQNNYIIPTINISYQNVWHYHQCKMNGRKHCVLLDGRAQLKQILYNTFLQSSFGLFKLKSSFVLCIYINPIVMVKLPSFSAQSIQIS